MTAFLLVAILPVSVRLIDKPVNRKFSVNRLTANIPSRQTEIVITLCFCKCTPLVNAPPPLCAVQGGPKKRTPDLFLL